MLTVHNRKREASWYNMRGSCLTINRTAPSVLQSFTVLPPAKVLCPGPFLEEGDIQVGLQ